MSKPFVLLVFLAPALLLGFIWALVLLLSPDDGPLPVHVARLSLPVAVPTARLELHTPTVGRPRGRVTVFAPGDPAEVPASWRYIVQAVPDTASPMEMGRCAVFCYAAGDTLVEVVWVSRRADGAWPISRDAPPWVRQMGGLLR